MGNARTISEIEQQRRNLQRAVSITEFCQRYGTGRTKVYEELQSGRLRGRKVGKRTIISVWTGIGAIGTAILGIYLFAEPATALRLSCITLILCGIVGLKLVT
jgi:hypothetical protein